jgi:hypothetical protein
VCCRNLITRLTSAASPRVDISSTCKVGQKFGVSLPPLTFSPSAWWPSQLLYRRGRISRRDLWITLYFEPISFSQKSLGEKENTYFMTKLFFSDKPFDVWNNIANVSKLARLVYFYLNGTIINCLKFARYALVARFCLRFVCWGKILWNLQETRR